MDITSQTQSAGTASKLAATTYPGRVSITLGGVARNMAETATRILSPLHTRSTPSPVKLVTPHGDDDFGLLLRTGLEHAGMRTDGLFVPSGNHRTAVCSLMIDDSGDLISGVADMDIGKAALTSTSTSVDVKSLLEFEAPRFVVFDGNIGQAHADELLKACRAYNASSETVRGSRPAVLTVFEPTSVAKSVTVLSHFAAAAADGTKKQPISFTTPNAVELDRIHAAALDYGLVDPTKIQPTRLASSVPSSVLPQTVLDKAHDLVQAGIFETVLLKVGRHGVVTIDASRAQHHPVPAGKVEVVNTTGCGDSFAGAFAASLFHLLAQSQGTRAVAGRSSPGDQLDLAVRVGQLAARRTLISTNAVGEGMEDLLLKQIRNT